MYISKITEKKGYFLFLLTNFTVIIIKITIAKKPNISCHQNCITPCFKTTVKTTKNKIKVAISLNCLSLIFGIGKSDRWSCLSWIMPAGSAGRSWPISGWAQSILRPPASGV